MTDAQKIDTAIKVLNTVSRRLEKLEAAILHQEAFNNAVKSSYQRNFDVISGVLAKRTASAVDKSQKTV